MLEHTITVSKPQGAFLDLKCKYGLFRGGIGSGKTYCGGLFVLMMVIMYPKALGLICANTYKQLNDGILHTLFTIMNELNIPYKYVGGAKAHLTIWNTKIICRSVQKYDEIRGPSYGWALLDEASLYKWEAIQVIIGRMRDLNGPRYVRCTTTPRGFNWLYDFFEEGKNQNRVTITAKTSDNKYLPDDYHETLDATYDEKFLKQERDGDYINIYSGQVYYAFDRDKHVKNFDKTWFKNHQKLIGVDFNVNPITAVQCWKHINKLYIGAEVWKKDSNTYELAGILVTEHGTHNVILHPDSTGNSRKTSAVKTDHRILRDNGFTLKVKTNPAVKDRHNCVNGLFAHDRIIIHPDCKKTIRDLEQLTHDNTDDMLSHNSDGLGYVAWHHFPIQDMYTHNQTLDI